MMEMQFDRSWDWQLIKGVVTHPRVYPHISDDFCPPAEQWEPNRHESIWYVVVRDGGELLGLWMFVPHNAICWEIHTCLLPSAWGRRAREAAQQGWAWLWANSSCVRVITDVPECNRLALRFARAAGMTQYGLNPKSYMKNGQLHDVILLGISRPN
jgi:RimJ/RimL family protein N-acetyltransferase